jgi:hypothetical protein
MKRLMFIGLLFVAFNVWGYDWHRLDNLPSPPEWAVAKINNGTYSETFSGDYSKFAEWDNMIASYMFYAYAWYETYRVIWAYGDNKNEVYVLTYIGNTNRCILHVFRK